MNSSVVKRTIVVGGRKTSISLEDPFWAALREIARSRGITLSEAVSQIDRDRRGNRSSAIRIHVLEHFRACAAPMEDKKGDSAVLSSESAAPTP